MIEKLNELQHINKDICKFCKFYEEDYMPYEDEEIHLEWCHYNDGKYSIKTKNQIMSYEIHDCDGFKEKIEYYLKKIEQEYDITILYAVESGSRVWGFFNEESDYDIRFIYKHNKLSKYLHVNNKYEDVMIFSDGLYDTVGWDIKKTLWLYSKNNPSLYEWLNSDLIYVEGCLSRFKELPPMNNKSLLHHYVNMGRKNWNKYCINWRTEEDITKVCKKFLYVIRCILSWNMIFNDIKPCLNINKLLGQNIDNQLLPEGIDKNISFLDFLYSSYSLHEPIYSLKQEVEYVFEKLEDWIISSLNDMLLKTDKYISNNINSFKEEYNKLFYELVVEE